MPSIKDEPTEGESPVNGHPSLSVKGSTNPSAVKCEWSLKESCACADGQCEDCQATTDKEDEKDDILTLATVTPLDSPETDETDFHPSIWEDCEAAEDTSNTSDAENEDVKPVFGQVDENLVDGQVIEPLTEQVNTAEIKEEISDNADEGNACEEAELQVDASQVTVQVDSDSPLVPSCESTRPIERFTVNVPAIDEAIVKSESEEEVTLGAQLPIISPPEQHQRPPEESNSENNEIKEKAEEEGPMIEEVNPEEIKEEIADNAEEEGNACEEMEMQVEEARHGTAQVDIKEEITDNAEEGNANKEAEMVVEASQMAAQVHLVSPAISSRRSTQPTNVNVSAVEEVIVKSESEEEEISPVEIKEEITDSVAKESNACKETEMEVEEASQGTDQVDSLSRGSTREGKGTLPALAIVEMLAESENETNSNHQPSIIQQAIPEKRNQEVIANSEGSESRSTEPDEEVAVTGQAEATALSSLSLRRSTRVRKSAVNYALLPEAEEETHQDDPDTGTSDSEESDSDESETGIDMEMGTDAPSDTEESSSIAIAASSERISPKAFPCRYCEKAFKSKLGARLHEETVHHQIERPRPFLCSVTGCGKAFVSQSQLDKHSLIHSGLKPFACSTCGAAFAQKGNLKGHQKTHTDERPYACKVCKKGFKTKNHLKLHHQGKTPCASRYAPRASRPFSCTVPGCGKAFKERSNLRVHIRAHSGAKEFKCTVCGGAFTRKACLKKHSRKLHGI